MEYESKQSTTDWPDAPKRTSTAQPNPAIEGPPNMVLHVSGRPVKKKRARYRLKIITYGNGSMDIFVQQHLIFGWWYNINDIPYNTISYAEAVMRLHANRGRKNIKYQYQGE